ncbi:hypothetical protein AB0901_25475 [Streptomyces roseifaciens]
MYEKTKSLRHPLTDARESLGLSKVEYARRIAMELEKELGYRPPVRDHRKVLRWETGIVPQAAAQRAIARFHGIQEAEAERLGWPDFLYLAVNDHTADQPWTPAGATELLNQTLKAQPRDPHRRPARTATGPAFRNRITAALDRLRQPHPLPDHPQRPRVPLEVLAHSETRIERLELQEVSSPVTAQTLYYASVNEHRRIVGHLTHGGYDGKTAHWLFGLASRTSALCGWLSICRGEYLLAMDYYDAALRAATAAGSRALAVHCMTELAFLQSEAGDPDDALFLVRSARAAAWHLSPRRRAVLHAREAAALSRLGQPGALRSLDLAHRALALEDVPESEVSLLNIDSEWLAHHAGRVHLRMGHYRRALEQFTPALNLGPVRDFHPAYPPSAAARHLHPVDAFLAVGEVEAAVHITNQVVAIAGTLPEAIRQGYRQRFTPLRTQPSVKELLDSLDQNSATL